MHKVANFLQIGYSVIEIKNKMLHFESKIRFIISEFKKTKQIHENQFELFVKYWNFNITLIYSKLKQNKTKKNMVLLKKLLNINETYRNLAINESMKNSKIEFILKLKEWKRKIEVNVK